MKEHTSPCKPAVVVVGYNRPFALNRLLHSLGRAHYPENVPLVISIDHGGEAGVRKVAEDFEWEFGEKRIIYHPQNLGLRAHIISCGDLSLQYGNIILLEDDLYVSPWFYTYAVAALTFYREEKQLGGIALYSPWLNGHARNLPFYPYRDGADTYFSQMVCSWGQAWSADQWGKFRDWLEQGKKVLPSDKLPFAIKNWKDHSWVKIFSRYMIEANCYFVYPHVAYSTNMGDIGVHFAKNESAFQVPLQMGRPFPNFKRLEDSLAVYDIFLDMIPERLSELQPMLKAYDYVVDLFGVKDLELYEEPVVLTQKPVSQSIQSFGRSLIPWELNVIENIPGDEIHLAYRKDVLSMEKLKTEMYEFYYSGIPLRPLVGLTWEKLRQRKPLNWLVS